MEGRGIIRKCSKAESLWEWEVSAVKEMVNILDMGGERFDRELLVGVDI